MGQINRYSILLVNGILVISITFLLSISPYGNSFGGPNINIIQNACKGIQLGNALSVIFGFASCITSMGSGVIELTLMDLRLALAYPVLAPLFVSPFILSFYILAEFIRGVG